MLEITVIPTIGPNFRELNPSYSLSMLAAIQYRSSCLWKTPGDLVHHSLLVAPMVSAAINKDSLYLSAIAHCLKVIPCMKGMSVGSRLEMFWFCLHRGWSLVAKVLSLRICALLFPWGYSSSWLSPRPSGLLLLYYWQLKGAGLHYQDLTSLLVWGRLLLAVKSPWVFPSLYSVLIT